MGGVNPTRSADEIRIANEIIDADELRERVALAKRELAPASAIVLHESSTQRTSSTYRWRFRASGAANRALYRGPGLRGRLVFLVQRVIRRLTAWEIEPLYNAHAELAEGVSDALTEALARVEQLERQLAVLRTENLQ